MYLSVAVPAAHGPQQLGVGYHVGSHCRLILRDGIDQVRRRVWQQQVAEGHAAGRPEWTREHVVEHPCLHRDAAARGRDYA